ncbi:MAG TPA: carboxypeptidase regulatory-like domain-containing protein [Terriglobales bacterium]|nr:carboxypeptidase regulatory-like domain-containing protein [Terriglobales bacterium]
MVLRRCCCFCLCLIVLLCSVPLWADVTGSILGQVRDGSGAVVPNASVNATQTATGYSRTVTCDAQGQFSMLALPPGRYRLTTSVPGFQRGVIDNVDLNVNDALHFDFVLRLGSVTESISVDASAVQIQTVTTALGTTIESPQILAMPLNGRSYLDLLSLQPGVAPANTNGNYNDRSPSSGLYNSSGNVSTNGQPEFANAFLVNGAEVNETKNMGAGLIPDADSIAEFRLLTNSFSAEYGKFTGAVMNTVTKSGTNAIHGTLFEFYRNQGLDAINYFDPSKAALKQHQFGGVVGGPIWRDKLFFFVDYQGTRQVAGASTGNLQVLSNDERNGIFPDSVLTNTVQGAAWASTLVSRGGGTITAGVTTYDQLGTAVTTTGLDSNGNPISVPGRDISAYIDPVTKLTLPFIPNANQGNGFNFDDSSHSGTLSDTNTAQRIDFLNHKTGDWSFYYHYDKATGVQPVYNNNGVENVPGFPVTVPSRNQLFVMSNTKTIGSSAVNVARISFFRTQVHTAQPSAGSAIPSYSQYGFNTDPTTGGLVNTGTPGYPSSLPTLFFNNFGVGNNWLNLYQPETSYGVGDTFSKSMGNHSVTFGGDFRYYQLNARNECGPNGYYNFNGAETGGDVSDYYIGAPNQFVQCSIQLLDNRTRYGALFGQDSWKVKPNLTVNYGLRWDVPRPWSDVYGRLTTPVPGEQSVKFPNSPPGNLVPGDPGVPSTISPTRWNNFGPRLGIAYSPSGGIWGQDKTSIRAAFGIYYLGVADNGNFGILGDAPWGLYWASPAPTEFASPYITRSNGVTQGQHFPFIFPSGPGPFPDFQFGSLMPLYVPGYYNKNKTTTANHYNVSIQRQLDKSTVLTVAYVGSQDHHIEHGEDLLWGDSALCLSLSGVSCGPGGEGNVYTQGGNTYFGTFTGAINNQGISQNYHNSSGGPVVAFASATYLQNSGNSNYNSLQVSAERRARDVTFLASYTYAKSLDDVSAKWDPRTPSRAYGLSSFDMRHNLVLSYNWTLPFDRLLGPRRMTQGWHITGITRFNTGVPVSLKSGGDVALTNIGLDYPNQEGSIHKLNPRDSANNQYFNKSAFNFGLSCGYETCGVTGSARQYLFNGPGAINTDAGVEKDTKITERVAINFRFEMFNVFNHTNFLSNSVVGNANSGQFGQATNTAPARIGQISGKLIF